MSGCECKPDAKRKRDSAQPEAKGAAIKEMTGKLKLIFGDFLRALRQLWLEFIGGIFLALGVLFIVAAIQEYRKYVGTPEIGTGRFLLVLLSSGVMLFFGLESFWKARKSR